MEAEIEKFNLLHLDVKITKPFIDIFHVFLFDVFELIRIKIDHSIQNWHFKLASIDLEISINDREGSPTDYDVLRYVLLGGQVDNLKHDDI